MTYTHVWILMCLTSLLDREKPFPQIVPAKCENIIFSDLIKLK